MITTEINFENIGFGTSTGKKIMMEMFPDAVHSGKGMGSYKSGNKSIILTCRRLVIDERGKGETKYITL